MRPDLNFNEDIRLIEFIIEYYTFIKIPDFTIIIQLQEIKNYSKHYYLNHYFRIKSSKLFEKLNEIKYLKSFVWDSNSFEDGIAGKNGQIDHLIPEQIDHRFRFKMTT